MWRALKISWKKSRKPFDTIEGICGNIVMVLAVAILIFSQKKELGDYMTLWALAIPPLVFGVFVIWNIIKLYHKFRRDRTPAIVTTLLFFCASLTVLFVIQILQNVDLKKQLNPLKQVSIVSKRLPDKIIPRFTMSNVVSTASPPQVTNVELPMQFETNSPITNDSDPEGDLASIKAKKLAAIAAKQEDEKKKTQSNSDKLWNEMRPTYKVCLETFYNILKKEADQHNEGIAKTVNYFNCLPSTIDYESGETNVAEIKFQNQTSMDFQITITDHDQFWHRGLKISSNCGYFIIIHSLFEFNNFCDVTIHVEGLHDSEPIMFDQIGKTIEEDLKLLKDGQIDWLTHTNHVKQ